MLEGSPDFSHRGNRKDTHDCDSNRSIEHKGESLFLSIKSGSAGRGMVLMMSIELAQGEVLFVEYQNWSSVDEQRIDSR